MCASKKLAGLPGGATATGNPSQEHRVWMRFGETFSHKGTKAHRPVGQSIDPLGMLERSFLPHQVTIVPTGSPSHHQALAPFVPSCLCVTHSIHQPTVSAFLGAELLPD